MIRKVLGDYFINKNFFLLINGAFVSMIGTRIYEVAITWWVYQKTGSSLNVGWFLIATFLPRIIASPYSGYVLDHTSRRNIMVLMDILRGLLMLFLFIPVAIGKLTIIYLAAITILVSICDAFFNPAVNSLIPDIINKELFVRGNSLYQLSNNVSKVLGPVFGATLLQVIGVGGIILINALSFVISGMCVILIKVEEKHLKTGRKSQTFIKDSQECKIFFKKNVFILSLVILIGVLNFFTGALHVLLPVHVKRLGMESIQYGSLLSALSVGAIVAMVITTISKIEVSILFLAISLFVYGLSILVFSLTSSFIIMIISYFVVGIGQTIFNVNMVSILQKIIPIDLRGKVFSIVQALTTALIPISYGVFGMLGNYFKTSYIFILTSVALLTGGIYVFLSEKLIEETKKVKTS